MGFVKGFKKSKVGNPFSNSLVSRFDNSSRFSILGFGSSVIGLYGSSVIGLFGSSCEEDDVLFLAQDVVLNNKKNAI